MEVSFDVDINLDEENSHSKDDCELHNDYDNQKLFDIYDSYLNRSDLSDSESEPELSFSDQFYQLVSNKCSKTPIKSRRISCLADIESQTPRISRKSLANDDSNKSLEESVSEIPLPWNLKEMTDQQIIDLGQSLEEEIFEKETNGPQIAANQIKQIYDKEIQFFNQMSEDSEKKFQNCLEKVSLKSDDQRLDFNQLIAQQLDSNKYNSEELTKLLFQLNVIQEISKK